MRIRFNSVTGNLLMQEHMFMKKIELSLIKKQIEVLATFMPDEILRLNNNELNQIYNFVGVLLFADVSGFTPLTEKYNKTGKGGIYRLTATLNAYIGAIVEVLYFYGGDVLKFSGDAFLALWKVLPDDSLFEILHEVVVCALVIQHTLGYFDTEVNVQLKVKLAISCGNMTFSVIGDDITKHYIILGDAINDVKEAERASVSGDVVISPGAWSHMLQECYEVTYGESGNVKVWNVFYKPNEESKKEHYEEKQIEVLKLIEMHINHRNMLHARHTFDSNLTDSKVTEQFIRSLPQRVQVKLAPKHWIVEELRPFIIKNVQSQVDESQPVNYLTEMREITVLFINIVPKSNNELLLTSMVNSAYQITCNIVGECLGVVNKVSLFDKDAMLLVLFGLRGVKHEMESQHALRSAYRIRTTVAKLEGAKRVSVGVTNGFVYCGVVGHPMRREYTVIGGAVNKAARIMCAYEDKVTCDYRTFKHSKLSSFYFQLQTQLKLKGIEEVGNIFEYNETFDHSVSSERTLLPVIGRNHTFNLIREIIYRLNPRDQYYGVCIHGHSKVGKTAIIRYCLSMYEKTNNFDIASVELDGSKHISYYCLSGIYRQIYHKRARVDSEDMNSILNIPRELIDRDEIPNEDEDIALKKYRTLNYFRDLVKLTSKLATLIFIDNLEHIDIQSWEILKIVINEGHIRLIAAATLDDVLSSDLHFEISLNDHIKLIELPKLHHSYIAALACQFLDATGLPASLVSLLVRSCDGRPGHIQSCLLRLVNNGSVELKLINRNEKIRNLVFPPLEYIGKAPADIITIINFAEKYKSTNDGLTLAAISLDLFDSFTPYQQLVIKTGAVLGDLFTRTLLLVALKYPSEMILAKVISQLFEEEVFDCGSRYMYSTDIETNKFCCRCFFEEGYLGMEDRLTMPKYAFCKILHFKNKSIRDVAYDLLPGNQRKELHLLCTDVLESMNNICPDCMKEPANISLHFCKFKDVMVYCNDINAEYYSTKAEYCNYDDMKAVIREIILSDRYKPDPKGGVSFLKRPPYNQTICNCYEIILRNYKELIYHSVMAGHLGKRIFFNMQFGLMLVSRADYATATKVLTEARELCLIDAKMPNSQVSELFRKIHVGQIQLGLAKSSIDLRQLIAARSHLSIALRQYNLPSIALSHNIYNKLLTRSMLVSLKTVETKLYKNTITRRDMGVCLGFCGKLFSLEGNWKLAKLTCAYSIYLLSSVNTNIPMLVDVYCNAIDIYRHSNQMHTCEKLQKNVLKELQLNYAHDISNNLVSLLQVLTNTFEIRSICGDICGAIRLGFRVIDIILTLFTTVQNYKEILWLQTLLMYNFRIKDCGDISKLLLRVPHPICNVTYYAFALLFFMNTGFIIEETENIIHFAEHYFVPAKLSGKMSWSDHYFIAVIHLHFLRLEKYANADDWKIKCSFNRNNVKRDLVIKTLRLAIECKILTLLRSRRLQNPYIIREENSIDELMKLFKHQVFHQYSLYIPSYLVLKAWLQRLRKHPKRSERTLNTIVKISTKQRNLLYKGYAAQLRNSWRGGFSFPYSDRPVNIYHAADNFTLAEFSQYMYALPLD